MFEIVIYCILTLLGCMCIWNCIHAKPRRTIDVPIGAVMVTVKKGICIRARRKTTSGFVDAYNGWEGSCIDKSGVYFDS